jgi:diguanylate cyclase (GGDEF)-like protein
LIATGQVSSGPNSAQRIYGIIVNTTFDVINKKVIQQLQSINKAILSTLTESLIIIDKEEKIVSISPGFFKMWELRKDNFEGNLFTEIQKRISSQVDMEKSSISSKIFLFLDKEKKKKEILKLHDGRIIERKSSPYHSNGKIEGYCWYFKDITQQLKLVERLGKLAFRDSLTKLYNRRWCEKKLKQLLRVDETNELSFLYMDLDHFKVINDSCGHYHGDHVLEEIGQLLLSVVGEKAFLSRLGGDEFGLILTSGTVDEVLEIANDFKEAISDYSYQWKGKFFKIGVSIGIVFIQPEDDFKTVFVHADEACYLSKYTGRNKCVVYNSEKEEFKKGKTQLKWYDSIQQALLHSQFVLWCQPIMHLEENHVHHEVLLRMIKDDGTIISPSAFMSSADRFGLIFSIDKWVIENFCKFYSENRNKLNNSLFSINLSGNSLSRKQFLNYVLDCLKKYQVNPEDICFEITESEIIKNFDKALVFINEVKKLGCKISLDDFGKGLTSFSYLKNIPFDHIKIDGQFVRELNEDEINKAIIKSIVYIAEVMNKKTIAEHIESDSRLIQMSELGVDYFQGNYFSKPFPILKLVK